MSDRTYELMMELGAELGDSMTMAEATDTIVKLAAHSVGSENGGITMLAGAGRRFETHGATNQTVEEADHRQHELIEGPCVDASLESRSLASSSLATDSRWPRWGPEAAALGLESILSVEMHARKQRIGALNIYGTTDHQFTTDDLDTIRLYAAHGAAVLGFASEVIHLGVALDTRSIIGQAQGVLMEKYDLDADRAFAFLKRQSQDTNTRLIAVAQAVLKDAR